MNSCHSNLNMPKPLRAEIECFSDDLHTLNLLKVQCMKKYHYLEFDSIKFHDDDLYVLIYTAYDSHSGREGYGTTGGPAIPTGGGDSFQLACIAHRFQSSPALTVCGYAFKNR